MSMPENLTIYKVPFGEDGFLLSFIEPPFGAEVESEEYVSMKKYAELSRSYENIARSGLFLRGEVTDLRFQITDLRSQISELLEDKEYLQRKLDEIDIKSVWRDDGSTT